MKTLAALCAISLAGLCVQAKAQTDFPSRPIQLLVGNAAGGANDVLARILAQEVKKSLGWDIAVVNRVGASGRLAMTGVTTAPPDGHTLGITPSNVVTTIHFLQDLPPDLIEQSTSLLAIGQLTPAFFVRGDSSVRSVKDLTDLARGGTKVSIGTPGPGTNPHLVMRAVAQQENVQFDIVPFNGTAPALTALLGGHVMAVGGAVTGWESQVADGKLRIIASLGDDRLSLAPNAPTLNELGLRFSAQSIFYLYGPRNLPEPLAKRITEAFRDAARTPAFIDMAKKAGVEIKQPLSGAALERFLIDDRARTGAMVQALGLGKS